jgi:hypothetical protein
LPTKAHFSSNWTSRVRGGNGYQLVVERPGVLAGQEAVADDGVLVDADEATGLADAATLGDVGKDGDDLVLRESGVEQGGALAFGEAFLTGAAGQHAASLRAVAEADAEVAQSPLAVVGAVGVLTAEAGQVLTHGGLPEAAWVDSPFRES